MNVSAEPLSRAAIRKITWKLRELMGYDKNEYFPIVHLIEWVLANPDNDFGLEFEIVDEDDLRDTYGITNTARNTIKIRCDVYERAVQGNPRDRFTLCHELGHYFLHQPESINYARGKIPAYCDPEWQANTFAAELLAPEKLISGLSVGEIADKCGISYQAAEIQYKMVHK